MNNKSNGDKDILWTTSEVVEATGGKTKREFSAGGISIDSRSVTPGDLFIALEGPNFDGHDYIGAALEAGAAAAVAHRRPTGLPRGAPLVMVKDSLAALGDLGRFARARSNARVIGVTGSVGKTGTKEALRHCLSGQGPTVASMGSLNNHWGLPLSLARTPHNALYGVYEMGMNHPGEIRELTKLARPHVALITAIAPAHSAFFDSLDQIAEAKAEIFEGLAPGGTAVIGRDSPYYELLAQRVREAGAERLISFGQHPEADARLINYTLQPGHSTVRALIGNRALDYFVNLPGAHWVMNSLAVLATIKATGADVGAAAGQLCRLKPLKGRGAREVLTLNGGSFELIDDSYNANPTSMAAAIAVLMQATLGNGGRRIAVLGDMLELGDKAPELHAALAEPIKAAGIDLVYTCGPNMAALHDALPKTLRGGHTADSRGLAPMVAAALRPGDTVLVKGSLGSKMAIVIKALEALDTLGDTAPRVANGE
ncbi:MAG: UDP-N-acetylmuramoylalanyl-D-glutamyl-2,6-diaminopimelate--D-alanyl-D-alanine ligase [Pseudomonadota bacterium]